MGRDHKVLDAPFVEPDLLGDPLEPCAVRMSILGELEIDLGEERRDGHQAASVVVR